MMDMMDGALTEEGRVPLKNQELDEDAFLQITVELIVNGQSLYRKLRARDVAHIDWNPIINDLAEKISHGQGTKTP
jgi:hypothetical protein